MRRPLASLTVTAAVLGTFAVPVSTAQAGTVPASARVGTARENMVVRLVNARRAKKKGCRALKHHPQLHRASRTHSADMAEHGYFSHTSSDGLDHIDRIKAAGYKRGSRWSENLGKGQRTPAMAVQSWMNYAGTKAAIMNCKFTVIGVGAVDDSDGKIVWTQVFAD
ncbi:CAP domain-containing protein [Nonomuraea sp. NPDC048892]|uniref:CAP domain-containing protein n=1 Tax=Nonomuraea sp. NPDC048892 TaxID=3154624 RepID=UPI0033F0FD6E